MYFTLNIYLVWEQSGIPCNIHITLKKTYIITKKYNNFKNNSRIDK